MLDESAVLNDLGQNKRQLESIIDREVRHFAYPFGDPASCSERDFRLAKAAGLRRGHDADWKPISGPP